MLVLTIVWGYNWVALKVATDHADALSVSALRMAVATVCLFAALVLTRRSPRPTPFVPTIILSLLQTRWRKNGSFRVYDAIFDRADGVGPCCMFGIAFTVAAPIVNIAPGLMQAFTLQRRRAASGN